MLPLDAKEIVVPLFFFHVLDGVDSPDTEGTELPDVFSARKEAIRAAGLMLAETDREFWAGDTWTMRVTDERGEAVCDLRFTATVAPSSADRQRDKTPG